jgi:hypothetical protein
MDCCREVRGHGPVDAQLSVKPIEDPEARLGANHVCGLATGWNGATSERMLDHPLEAGRGQLLQGVFTHALLTVLSRAAAGVVVTSHTLEGQVKAEVETLDGREDQRPIFHVSPEHAAPIVFAGPAGAAPAAQAAATANAEVGVTVRLSDPARGFEVVGGDAQTVVLQRPGPVAAEQSIRLRPGFYEFRPVVGDQPDPPVLRKIVGSSSGAVIHVQL